MQRSLPGPGIAAMAAMLVACSSGGASPHADLTGVWREYVALQPARALAIAGDPRRDRWVSSATGSHLSPQQAESRALSECQALRRARRIQAACVLYAVGDEIVWSGR